MGHGRDRGCAGGSRPETKKHTSVNRKRPMRYIVPALRSRAEARIRQLAPRVESAAIDRFRWPHCRSGPTSLGSQVRIQIDSVAVPPLSGLRACGAAKRKRSCAPFMAEDDYRNRLHRSLVRFAEYRSCIPKAILAGHLHWPRRARAGDGNCSIRPDEKFPCRARAIRTFGIGCLCVGTGRHCRTLYARLLSADVWNVPPLFGGSRRGGTDVIGARASVRGARRHAPAKPQGKLSMGLQLDLILVCGVMALFTGL